MDRAIMIGPIEVGSLAALIDTGVSDHLVASHSSLVLRTYSVQMWLACSYRLSLAGDVRKTCLYSILVIVWGEQHIICHCTTLIIAELVNSCK